MALKSTDFVLFEPCVRLYSFSLVTVTEWPPIGNSCSFGLRYVFQVLVPNCQFSFFPPRILEFDFLSDCAFS